MTERAMSDFLSDWKRWSSAERVVAIAGAMLIIAFLVLRALAI